MNYSNFSLEDFVMDERFQSWVKSPDAESNRLWEAFLKLHPEKKEILDEAKKVITSINFKKHDPAEVEFQEVLDHILEAVPNSKERKLSNPNALALQVNCSSNTYIHFCRLRSTLFFTTFYTKLYYPSWRNENNTTRRRLYCTSQCQLKFNFQKVIGKTEPQERFG